MVASSFVNDANGTGKLYKTLVGTEIRNVGSTDFIVYAEMMLAFKNL